MSTPSEKTCERCGAPRHEETAGGLCPRCLMVMNFESRTMPDGGDPSTQAPLSPDELADRFPAFEILGCLGRGGMGVVYKARQKSLNRIVAIKILAPERMDEGRFAGRFTREAELLAKLGHPNIVTIHDFGESGGLFYLVMEFIDGVNLRDLLRDGKLEPKQALAIIPPICEALQYAHDKGIVHCDIKPENLLLNRDGCLKIADFGIAKLIVADADQGDPEGGEKEATMKAGTLGYSAPEQLSDPRHVDQRADIYSLGVVLYEMLTGERPDRDTVAPSRRVKIDVRLDEIVLRALEKTPERRYQTAEEFRTVLNTLAALPDPEPEKSTRRKKRRKKVLFRLLHPVPERNELLRLALMMALAGIALVALIGNSWFVALDRLDTVLDPERSAEGDLSGIVLRVGGVMLSLLLLWGWMRFMESGRTERPKSRSGMAWIIFGVLAAFQMISDTWNHANWPLIIVSAILLALIELIPHVPQPAAPPARDP